MALPSPGRDLSVILVMCAGPCPAIARVLFRVTACRCLSFQCIAWPALLMRLVHYLALCGRCCVHLSL